MSSKQNAKDSKLKVQVPMRVRAVVVLVLSCSTVTASFSQTKRHQKSKEPLAIPRGIVNVSPICKLTAEQFPPIRGFRLGMTLTEVKRQFVSGFEQARPDKFGMITVSLTAPASTAFPVAMNPVAFAGLLQLEFTFYEGRLIEASYEYAPAKWRHIREFLNIASPALKINSAQWEVSDTGAAKLDCSGFMVQARLLAFSSQQDMPKIIVTDTIAMAAVNKRRGDALRQSEEERRRAFRP